MWRSFAAEVRRMKSANGHQPQLHRLPRREAAVFGEQEEEEEDESIPGDRGSDDDSVQPHPWGGQADGSDEDHDFLRRDEWREEAEFRNVEFRRALWQQLQQHHTVRKPGEYAAWFRSPDVILQKLQDPCDPARNQLNQIMGVMAYSRIELNLVDELIIWVRRNTSVWA